MTNSPEAPAPDGAQPPIPGAPTHAPGPAPATAVAPAPVEPEPALAEPPEASTRRQARAAATDAAFDAGTYGTLIEPRSGSRLALTEGEWHQVSRKYVWVQLISSGIVFAIVVAATLVLALALNQAWAWIPGGIVIGILAWVIAITPRQARAIGYQLRDDDLVFRRGILWQRFVTVPYGRMQLVDITHGPLDRGFGIAQLKFVTAAAATGVVIPGLEQSTADLLRDHLVAVAESRRTGL